MKKTISNKIYFLSFVYTVLIVLFHWRWNSFGHISYLSSVDEFAAKAFFYFAEKMGYVCLGFFFFFSAFWFYSKNKDFTVNVQLAKIKKLLIPFIAWSIIVAIFFVVTNDEIIYKHDLFYWAFCSPIVTPLWYVLCIIIFQLTTPILFKRNREVSLVLIGLIITYLLLRQIEIVPKVFNPGSWWWYKNMFIFLPIYLIGAYIGRYHKEIVIEKEYKTLKEITIGILLILVGFIVWHTFDQGVLIISIIMINVGVWIAIKDSWFKKIPDIIKSNFYIYASHQQILIPIISYVSVKISKDFVVSGITMILLKIIQVTLVVVICFAIRAFLRKKMPRLDRILTGGR